MKHCCIVAFFVLFGSVSAALAAEIPRVPEPVIGGKGLSVWLKEYEGSIPGPEHEGDRQMGMRVEEAVRKIGTNAIPWLLQELSAKEATQGDEMPTNFYSGEAIKRRWFAAPAFRMLGGSARGATPALVRLLNDKQTSYTAALALAGVGEESIPVLTQALTNTHACARASAARVLASFGAKAQSAVPALIRCLGDEDQYVRNWSEFAMKKIDPGAATKADVK